MTGTLGRVLLCQAAWLLFAQMGWAQATSSWVYYDSNHQLQYKTDSQGNRIMDFSYAGYEGGGVPLPKLPVKVTLNPSGGDDTANIQNAINQVQQMPQDFLGFRGAVLLGPGTYNLSGPLTIDASGVVLRGSGSGAGGTVLNMTGTPFVGLTIAGSGTWQTASTSQSITDAFVPSGTNTVTVADASGFRPGQTVLIQRPVTSPWIHFMGMDTLLSGTGAPQTWISPGTIINTDRVIRSIHGNQLTFDAPLTDTFDSQYLNPPGAEVVGYTYPGRISQAGVEHLSFVAPAVNVSIDDPQFNGLQLGAVINGWVEDVVFQDTQNTVTIQNTAKQFTLDQVVVNHTVVHTGDRMADFGVSGTEILINKSASNGTGEWPMVMQSRVTGPIVLLNFTSTQAAGIAPHQRWGTGMLADSSQLPNAPNNPDGGATGIAYQDRGNHGSGQGWAAGWSVAWNVTTPYFVVQQFPGGENWCIGCVGKEISATEAGSGKPVPNGIYDSPGVPVTPSSLYLAQLEQRGGPAALANIGYGDFNVTATPHSQTVNAGNTASYTVNVAPSNGFSENVSLVAFGLPLGTTAKLGSQSINGGSGSTALTVTTHKETPPGNYVFTVLGLDGNLLHAATVVLTVQGHGSH
jgi:hypothetical protein